MSIKEIKDIKKLQQMLKSELELRKYTYKCCQEAGEELAKHSFAWDGKEKNLVIQAMELNERFEAKERECEELKKVNEEKNELLAKLGCPTIATARMKAFTLQQQLDQLKEKNGELKKINNHIEHNRDQKADKLMRIEKLITACSTGYTDEFIQELLVILHEPEPSSFENKYKSTLVEIKEVAENREIFCENCSSGEEEFTCDDCGYIKILQEIRKVMPDEN